MRSPHEAPARGALFQVKNNTDRSKLLIWHGLKGAKFYSGRGVVAKVGRVINRSPGVRGNSSSRQISNVSLLLIFLG